MSKTKSQSFLQPFDSTSSLFSTSIFQVSSLVFFIGACLSFWAASEVNSLNLCTDLTAGRSYWANCISNLWKYHTRGFLVIGAFFPIAALIASHLRSVQAADEIIKQKEQNQFENHFKHSEEFIKSWSEQGLSEILPKSFSLRELHGLIYPDSPKGNYRVSKDYLQKFDEALELLKLLIKNSKSRKTRAKQKELCEKISQHIEKNLKITDYLHYKYDFFPYHAKDLKNIIDEYKDLLNRVIAAISFYPEHSARGLDEKMSEVVLSDEMINEALEDRMMEEDSSKINRIISDIATGNDELKKAKSEELKKMWSWRWSNDPDHPIATRVDYRIQATFPFELALSESVFKHLPEEVSTWIRHCEDEHQVEVYEANLYEPWE